MVFMSKLEFGAELYRADAGRMLDGCWIAYRNKEQNLPNGQVGAIRVVGAHVCRGTKKQQQQQHASASNSIKFKCYIQDRR